jgi:ABC-type sugar transport system permease subunit
MRPRGRKSIRAFPAWTPWFFVGPFIVVFSTFVVWPLMSSLAMAFQQTYGPGVSIFVGLANFFDVFADPLFWRASRNTFTFAAASVFLQLPLSLGLALLLNRPNLRGRAIFRLVFFSPSLVGLVFVGMIFALVFERHTGLVNAGLHRLFPAFDPEFPWLQRYVMSSLVIAALWLYVGFNMIYFLAALQNVSRDLLEAASIDGASPWQRFRHVVVPDILPIAGFVVMLSTIGSLQLFELPWILLNNSAGPEDRGLTVVMYLFQNGFVTGDLGYASAVGWILAVGLMGITLVQRHILRGREY